MGREMRWLGVQSNMSDVFDRQIGDFEMELSFRDQWDFSDSGDEDMDPREMKELLSIMRQESKLYS